jgi:hypothetical protein
MRRIAFAATQCANFLQLFFSTHLHECSSEEDARLLRGGEMHHEAHVDNVVEPASEEPDLVGVREHADGKLYRQL